MDKYKNWLLEIDGHLARVSLNRPESNNDLTVETLVELRDISQYLGNQRDIWSVMLKSEGRHFSSGMQLDVFSEWLHQPDRNLLEFVRDQQRCMDALAELAKPTIAVIRGFCIGGGLLMALCCDFRIASDRTIFQLPEIKLGIPPLWGTYRVTQTVGPAVAKEMVLLGKRYRASEALGIGLVHQIVAGDELDAAAERFAAQFRTLPPLSVGLTKMMMDRVVDLTREESQELELDILEQLSHSQDLSIAIESYTRKTQPDFIGR